VDALIIATIVLLSVSINFSQSYRSQQAAERLRASVAPTATVLRDGKWQEITITHVVAGDVCKLSAGDLVPADARLLESRDLSVQQSMLTGESLPADKAAGNASKSSSGNPLDAPADYLRGVTKAQQSAVKTFLAVHVAHQRHQARLREMMRAVAHQPFLFAQ